MNISRLYDLFLHHPDISTDSRKIAPGGIFFALKGDNFDGNLFSSAALDTGAAYAVVDNRKVASGKKYILVENVLKTLQQLASFHRKKLMIPVLGVTGSNGKTTTKELIACVLKKKYVVGVTRGNLNNHIGVPLTVLSMNRNTQIGIVEMGANHPGEIDLLCNIAGPDYGLITNIGKAHLEGFGSFDGVIRAKTEIYRYLKKTGGKIFVHADNNLLASLSGDFPAKISYGSGMDCFLRAEMISSLPFVKAKAWFDKGEVIIDSYLTGDYNYENILAAACTGKYFNVDPELIREGIAGYLPQNNRSQITEKGTNSVIMDAYNANPTSMKASIENLIRIPSEQKIVILGDMLELGPFSAKEHQSVVDFLRSGKFSRIILIGSNFMATDKPDDFISLRDVAELVQYLKQNPVSNSLVLLKGSRGIGLERSFDSI